jgi:vacuolar protein sorting-associated protein 35
MSFVQLLCLGAGGCYCHFSCRALDADASAVIVRLLTLPLQSLSMRVLRLVNFPALMGVLRFDDKRAIARKVLSAVIQARTKLESAVEANQLLVFLAPVVRDVEGTPSEEADSKSEFEEEQHACGRLLYLIHNDSTDDHFRILSKVREHLGCGGTRRTPFTLPPLLFSSLRLLHRVVTNEAVSGFARCYRGC